MTYPVRLQDPFAEKSIYRDSPFDNAFIWLFSSKMKAELGDRIAGTAFVSKIWRLVIVNLYKLQADAKGTLE